MAAPDLHAALDTGFGVVGRVAGASGRDLEPDLVLDHAREIVTDDPDAAACAIFALAVESSDDPNLAWLYDEWKRRRREELGLPDTLGPTDEETS